MTLDQINHCLEGTLGSYVLAADINVVRFAEQVAAIVRGEMLSIARANCVVSDSANELYKDLQAYDRYESGLNF